MKWFIVTASLAALYLAGCATASPAVVPTVTHVPSPTPTTTFETIQSIDQTTFDVRQGKTSIGQTTPLDIVWKDGSIISIEKQVDPCGENQTSQASFTINVRDQLCQETIRLANMVGDQISTEKVNAENSTTIVVSDSDVAKICGPDTSACYIPKAGETVFGPDSFAVLPLLGHERMHKIINTSPGYEYYDEASKICFRRESDPSKFTVNFPDPQSPTGFSYVTTTTAEFLPTVEETKIIVKENGLNSGPVTFFTPSYLRNLNTPESFTATDDILRFDFSQTVQPDPIYGEPTFAGIIKYVEATARDKNTLIKAIDDFNNAMGSDPSNPFYIKYQPIQPSHITSAEACK